MFKGVSGDTSGTDLIFVAIIDRNASGFLTCYQKASELFKKLESVQNIFKASLSHSSIYITTYLSHFSHQ